MQRALQRKTPLNTYEERKILWNGSMDSARVHCARSVCINYTENKEVTYTNFRTTVEPADSVLLRFHRQTIDQLTDDLRRKKGCKGATILFTKQKVKSDFIRATIKVEIKGYNN